MSYQKYALTLVRLLLGITFLLHGAQKVFGFFGGPGLQGFSQYVGTLGFPSWMGYAAAVLEFAAGLLLTLGIAPELGALISLPIMAVAVVWVHGSKGFFIQHGGFEYALNLIVLALAVIIGGGGCGILWSFKRADCKK